MFGHQYRWLASGYDLEIRTSLEVVSVVITWWIVAFFLCVLAPSLSLKMPGLSKDIQHHIQDSFISQITPGHI